MRSAKSTHPLGYPKTPGTFSMALGSPRNQGIVPKITAVNIAVVEHLITRVSAWLHLCSRRGNKLSGLENFRW